MKNIVLPLLVIAQFMLPACDKGREITLTVEPSTLAPVVEGDNQFAFDLYAKLNANRENLFFSPFSISMALAMTYGGAAGETQRQMEEVLHFPYNDNKLHNSLGALLQELTYPAASESGFQMRIANRLWGEERPGYRFQETFLKLTRDFYDAQLEPVSFSEAPGEAAQKINDWVSKQTEGLIGSIVDPNQFSVDTLLVLTNAIYFKGVWTNEFGKRATKDEPFYLEDGTQKNVPLMHQRGDFVYGEAENLQLLQMPYRGNRLSMLAVLPRARDGLAAVENTLDAGRLGEWMAGMRQREVDVFFPRFRMETGFDLTETLKDMGMAVAFEPEADFLKMIELSGQSAPEQRIWLSSVLHKAFVEVDEEGTTAAAATAVSTLAESVSIPEPPPVFRADHPFLFLIRDDVSGSILFMGRVMKP